MRRLSRALVVFSLLGAGGGVWGLRRGPESPGVPAARESEPEEAYTRWRAGAQYDHAVSFLSRLGDATEELPPALLGFTAHLHTTVAEAKSGAVSLAMTLDGITGVSSDISPVPAADARALAQDLFVTLDRAGRVAGLWIAPNLAPGALGIWREVVSTLQFSKTEEDGTTWTKEEEDVTGELVAEYHASAKANQFEKSKRYYKRLASRLGLVAPHDVRITPETSSMQYTFSGGGMVRNVGSVNTAIIEVPGLGRRFRARTDALLTFVKEAATEERPTRPKNYRRVSLHADPESFGSSRNVDQATTLPLGELVSEARQIREGDEAAEGALVSRFEVLFDRDPTAITGALHLLDGKNGPMMLRALGRVQSPQAQTALCAVLGDRRRDAELRRTAALTLTSVKAPTVATVDALRQVVREGGDPAIAKTASFAVGIAAQKLKTSDPALAATVVRDLAAGLAGARTADDKARVLYALANTRHPDALPSMETALSSSDPRIRSTAALALRSMHDENAETLLSSVVKGDRVASVRAAALAALDAHPAERVLPTVESVTRNERDPQVRAAAVGVLESWLRRDGTVQARAALEWVAKHDRTPMVRERAQAALAAGPG